MEKKLVELLKRRFGNLSKNNLTSSGDFMKIVSDQSLFERKVIPRSEEIFPGVIFSQDTIKLGGRAFTNSYEVVYDPINPYIKPKVESAVKTFFLKDLVERNLETIVAGNGGFFFLVDEAFLYPVDITYNFCLRGGKVIGLPIVNRPVVYISKGKLFARELEALGTVLVSGRRYSWSGVNAARDNSDFVLFNSTCCNILVLDSPITKTRRVLDKRSIFTSRNKNIVDIVVKSNKNGDLQVVNIVRGGGANLFSGNFILRYRSTEGFSFKIGETVIPETIDDIKLSLLESGITIGPNIYDFQHCPDHPINYDPGHGSKLAFNGRRMARSIIYKDKKGLIHFRMFDGAPKTNNFQGVSPLELCSIIPKKNTEWAFYLDPGQSSKLAIKKNGIVDMFGNMHYLEWPKKKGKSLKWSPLKGRGVGSAITLFSKLQKM